MWADAGVAKATKVYALSAAMGVVLKIENRLMSVSFPRFDPAFDATFDRLRLVHAGGLVKVGERWNFRRARIARYGWYEPRPRGRRPAAPDPDTVMPCQRTSGAARLDCFQFIGFRFRVMRSAENGRRFFRVPPSDQRDENFASTPR